MYVGWLAKNGHQYISIDIMFDTFINCFTCFDFHSNNKENQYSHIQRKNVFLWTREENREATVPPQIYKVHATVV